MDALYRLNLGERTLSLNLSVSERAHLECRSAATGRSGTGSEATGCRVIGEAMAASSGVFRLRGAVGELVIGQLQVGDLSTAILREALVSLSGFRFRTHTEFGPVAATCWTRILVLTCTNGCSCWSPLEEIWAWFVVVSDTRYHLRHTPILTIYTIHSEVRRVGGAQCSVPHACNPLSMTRCNAPDKPSGPG